ncbi:hypothetical protein QYE76_066484 [Lolium multiflorum]|uniref:Uncharacterized protein n=1 Tax=Lolium multiflorum TaxID=4521 RepID=A0AAD8WC28_LOLMU|nr:hypothetical protein QYE76_066484 [Lolium multiflorum]
MPRRLKTTYSMLGLNGRAMPPPPPQPEPHAGADYSTDEDVDPRFAAWDERLKEERDKFINDANLQHGLEISRQRADTEEAGRRLMEAERQKLTERNAHRHYEAFARHVAKRVEIQASRGFNSRNTNSQNQMSRPGSQNRRGENPRPGGPHHNNNNSNHVHHNSNYNRAPQRAPANNNPNNSNTAPRTESNAIPVTPKDKATITCYEYGIVGHYFNECPKRLAKLAGNTSAPAQQQHRVSTGKKFAPNHPNNMNAAEAQEAPQARPREADSRRTTRAQDGQTMPLASHQYAADVTGHALHRPTPPYPDRLRPPGYSPRHVERAGHARVTCLYQPSPERTIPPAAAASGHTRATNMEHYAQTESYQLGNGGSLVFERDLDLVSEELERPPPEFHGVRIHNTPGGEQQWMITADLKGSMEPPMSERILFSFKASNWVDGLAHALQEGLARVCGQNIAALQGTRFTHFARHDTMREPMALSSHPVLKHHVERLDFMLHETRKDLEQMRVHAHRAQGALAHHAGTIRLLAKDRRSLRLQRAKRDATIARLREKIRTLEAIVHTQQDQIQEMEEDEFTDEEDYEFLEAGEDGIIPVDVDEDDEE